MKRRNLHKISQKYLDSICAGKIISKAMVRFSGYLYSGCENFAKLAKESKKEEDTIYFNTGCIFFSYSALEAEINEYISMNCIVDNSNFFTHLKKIEKNLKLDEKWNLFASHLKGKCWDYSKEPFQSFLVITSLRNELVHYKGTMFGKDIAPNKKIQSIMKKFKIKTQSKFMEDDCSGWVYDLLKHKDLGGWIFKALKATRDQIIYIFCPDYKPHKKHHSGSNSSKEPSPQIIGFGDN